MKKLLLIISIAFLISCSSDSPDEEFVQASPSEEELRKEISDSLIKTYKDVIDNPSGLTNVSIIVDSDLTVLGGSANNNLWIGIFSSDDKKEIEKAFPFEGQVTNQVIRGSAVTIIDDEFFFNAYLLNSNYQYDIMFPFHRFFFKYDIKGEDLKTFSQYFEEGEGSDVDEIQRGFEGSYLISTTGILFSQGSSDIIYLDSDFENPEVWKYNAHCLPAIDEVTFLNIESYFQWSNFLITGGRLSDCSGWSVDVWGDIFGFDGGCVGCTVNVNFMSEDGGNLIFEGSYQGVKRRFAIDNHDGEIVSNEVIA